MNTKIKMITFLIVEFVEKVKKNFKVFNSLPKTVQKNEFVYSTNNYIFERMLMKQIRV